MGVLAWVIIGLALWHYAIWLADHFWGGIVGAFLASIAGAILTGIVISLAADGVAIPARHATHLWTVLYALSARHWAWRSPTRPAWRANTAPHPSRPARSAARPDFAALAAARRVPSPGARR
jgi:hypothetical protein